MSDQYAHIRLRRGTAAEWSASQPQPDGEILRLGEPGYEKDTGKLKIGDGINGWNNLPYFADGATLSVEQIQDSFGTSFLVAGSGITLNYDDENDTLTISSSGGISGSGTSFQIGSIDLHNGGVQNAQILQFDNSSYQSVITGPVPPSGNNAQRLIIQGQRGVGGEGGDVYMWGGDADSNGGDIKIYAGDADNPSTGDGGYVNIAGGDGYDQGGHVHINGGNSTTNGGDIEIEGGYPSGSVTIISNYNNWVFNPDSTVSLPNNTLDAGNNSIDIKSSQYAELYFQSGPSGIANNWIENSTYNEESYIWTSYDGTYIQNIRSNDGTNPYWNHEWEFSNSGNLNLPEGKVVNWGQNIDTLGPPVAGGGTDRIRLWDFKGEGSNFNYAIGAEGNHVWFAMDVNNGTGGFKFYSRDNEIFKISDDSKLVFPNSTTLSQGTFDNSTGGGSGISLTCYVGYELNWQGGHLISTQDGGITAANILCDSAIEFPGSGIDNIQIDNTGITFSDGTNQTTAWTGAIPSSSVTDFNTAVSGLLPVIDIISGTGISISSVSGQYTINSTVSGVSTGEASVIKTTVFNKTGSPIPKFSVVYINGGQGDQPTIGLAVASGEMTSSKTYGITSEAIDNMSTGGVIVIGALSGINTDQFNPTAPTGDVNGTSLWLSPTTPGGVTTTKPSAPDHAVFVGTIVRTHQNQGVVEVRIQNGYELNELHNVAISGVTNNDILVYNSGLGLWQNNNTAVFSNTSLVSASSGINNIVSISQSNYDALGSYDPNTLYVIT